MNAQRHSEGDSPWKRLETRAAIVGSALVSDRNRESTFGLVCLPYDVALQRATLTDTRCLSGGALRRRQQW